MRYFTVLITFSNGGYVQYKNIRAINPFGAAKEAQACVYGIITIEGRRTIDNVMITVQKELEVEDQVKLHLIK